MSQESSKFPDVTKREKGKVYVKIVPDAETDINQIVKRFQETGQLPVNMESQKGYADVTAYSNGLIAAREHIAAQVKAMERLEVKLKELSDEKKRLDAEQAKIQAELKKVPPLQEEGKEEKK